MPGIAARGARARGRACSEPPAPAASGAQPARRARAHSTGPWSCLALALLVLAPGAGRADPPGFQKGVALGAWGRDGYAAATLPGQLDALRVGGVEWVQLTCRWFQAARDSIELAPDPERSPSDESLRGAIRLARARGLRVFLKPQIDLLGPGWRGEIRHHAEERWQGWFASYRRFLLHYAALAREEEVDLLAVGVELDGTRHRERDWRALVAAVREVHPGPLVYAANWGREEDIGFWDALDFAGVDEYAPLAAGPDTGEEELRARARRRRDRLAAWAERHGKPVLFTEIGFRSVAHAAVQPWEWEAGGPVDLALQARLVRVAIEVYGREPWLAGMYWWAWLATPPADPTRDDGFTTQGKPAWAEVRAFYATR